MDRDGSTRGIWQKASTETTAFRQSPERYEGEATRGQERKRKDSRPPRDPEPLARPPYPPYEPNWSGRPAISGQQLPPYQGQGSSPPAPPWSYPLSNVQQQQPPQNQGQDSSPPPLSSNYSSPNLSSPPQTNVQQQQPYYHNSQFASPSNPNTSLPSDYYSLQQSNHSYPNSQDSNYPSYDQSSGHHYFNQSQHSGNTFGYGSSQTINQPFSPSQGYHPGSQTPDLGQWDDGAGSTSRDMYTSPPPQRCRHGGVVGK
ncbi:MAG: hypothetical protein Q9214_003249 [Letrouitia sp. 1 TL-2023]